MMKIEASRSAFSSCNDRFMKNYKQDVPFERQMEILRDIEYVDAIPVTYSPDTDPAALRGFMAQFGISPGTVVLDTYSQPRFAKGTLTSRDAGLRREFIEKGKAAMDFCHDIGGVDVMLWLAHDGYDYPFEDDYAARYGWLVEGLREIASHRPDVNVTIEYKPADPHIYQYVSTAPKALTICNEVALPNLGIILDYGHALVAGENPAESAALIDRYKRLFHVHLSDIVMVMQEVEYVHKIERKIRQKLANKGLVAKNTFENICAESPALRETVRIAKQYAVVNSSVLITGETGTGKEMFAQSIHNFSPRRDEAFVAVNCATIPANLLESELFGYVEGAFTGAKRGGKVGLFELAHKGTIFLDEIGETSLDMQARLLRVLEEHEIMRVGDDKVIPIDIRVIAASNRDLKQMVKDGSFRSDFYYRLDVLSLQLPPLRRCRENIAALIGLFSRRYASQNNRRPIEYDDESMRILQNYAWPGNVRELKNVVERLVVTNSGGTVRGQDAMEALHLNREPSVPEPEPEPAAVPDAGDGLISAAEFELIRKVLRECGGNKTAAAKKLGISRPTLHRRLKLMEDGE